MLVLRKGIWFNHNVIASINLLLWIILVFMVRKCTLELPVVLSIVYWSKNCISLLELLQMHSYELFMCIFTLKFLNTKACL